MKDQMFAEKSERHIAFWKREKGVGALIGMAPASHVFPLQNIRIEHEGRLEPVDLTSEIIEMEASYHPVFNVEDALLPSKIPMEFMEWTQAYCGAEVYLSRKAGTVWTEPGDNPPLSLESLRNRIKPAWLEKIVEVTCANLESAKGVHLLSESLLRGPADCLEALVGAEQLCLMVYDDPALVYEMNDYFTDRIMEITKAQLKCLPRVGGGTVNRYRLAGKGENIVTQADISNVMSPDTFREHFMPHYRKLAAAFDTATIHFHSSAFQHTEALLEADCFDAIEWGMDPTGPTLEQMIPVFRKILETGPCLILMNIRTDAEVGMILSKLPHDGLCIIRRGN